MSATSVIESSAKVVHLARGPLDAPGFKFTPTGLIIDPHVSFEEWEQYGRKLQLADKGIQWALGDWVIFGEGKFKERAAQAIEFTGLKIKTLQNYATVAKAVIKSRRRDSDVVPFSTHAEVAMLPDDEQEKILAKAEGNPADFSSHDARKEAKRIKRKLKLIPDEIVLLHDAEVQRFLADYVEALQKIDDLVPKSVAFLHGMIQSHIGQTQWQKDRTIESDYEAITESFENVAQQTDSDIFKWLTRSGYFISDPDLDDRLEAMSLHSKMEQDVFRKNHDLRLKGKIDKLLPLHKLNCTCTSDNKRLAIVDQGGRKDGQRGDLNDLYMLYGTATGDAAKVAQAGSNYQPRD